MADLRKTVTKTIAVAILALGSYVTGYLQNPTYSQLPPKAQIAVRETHAEVAALIRSAVAKYKQGNWRGAIEDFNRAKRLMPNLEKIDPQFRTVEALFTLYDDFIMAQERAMETVEGQSALFEQIKKLKDRPLMADRLFALYVIGIPPTFEHALVAFNHQELLRANPALNRALLTAEYEIYTRWKALLLEVEDLVVVIIADEQVVDFNRGKLEQMRDGIQETVAQIDALLRRLEQLLASTR